jgi:ABC-type multidrug transport system ATPase subunit
MSTFTSPTFLDTSIRRDVPAVEVRNLTKVFRRRDRRAGRFARRRMPALKNVTFTIERGECVAILGQNGGSR